MSEPNNKQDIDRIDQGEDVSTEALTQALRSGFYLLYTVIVALLIYFFVSNWFRLSGGEEAVVLRFGKQITDDPLTEQDGLQYALPYPIDEKIIVTTGEQEVTSTVGWYAPSKRKDPQFDAANDGHLIANDMSLIHVKATLEYRVSDATTYNFGFYRDSQEGHGVVEEVLQCLLDKAITTEVSGFDGSSLIRGSAEREEFQKKIKQKIEGKVGPEEYNLGVEVIGVRLSSGVQGVDPIVLPRGEVQRRDAILKQNQNKYTQDLAATRTMAKEINVRAGMLASKRMQMAESEAREVANRVKSEYNKFMEIYRIAMDDDGKLDERKITTALERMRNEKLEEILKSGIVDYYVVPTMPDGTRMPIHLSVTPPPPPPPKATELSGAPEDEK